MSNPLDSFEEFGSNALDDPVTVAPQTRSASQVRTDAREPQRSMEDVIRDADRTGARVSDFYERVATSCVVGGDTVVEGHIRVTRGKSIVVRGFVNGHIECDGYVLVLPEGRIGGDVRSAYLWNEGKIEALDGGLVTVDVGVLHMGPGGAIKGNVTYDHLSMANGNKGVRGTLETRQHADPED